MVWFKPGDAVRTKCWYPLLYSSVDFKTDELLPVPDIPPGTMCVVLDTFQNKVKVVTHHGYVGWLGEHVLGGL